MSSPEICPLPATLPPTGCSLRIGVLPPSLSVLSAAERGVVRWSSVPVSVHFRSGQPIPGSLGRSGSVDSVRRFLIKVCRSPRRCFRLRTRRLYVVGLSHPSSLGGPSASSVAVLGPASSSAAPSTVGGSSSSVAAPLSLVSLLGLPNPVLGFSGPFSSSGKSLGGSSAQGPSTATSSAVFSTPGRPNPVQWSSGRSGSVLSGRRSPFKVIGSRKLISTVIFAATQTAASLANLVNRYPGYALASRSAAGVVRVAGAVDVLGGAAGLESGYADGCVGVGGVAAVLGSAAVGGGVQGAVGAVVLVPSAAAAVGVPAAATRFSYQAPSAGLAGVAVAAEESDAAAMSCAGGFVVVLGGVSGLGSAVGLVAGVPVESEGAVDGVRAAVVHDLEVPAFAVLAGAGNTGDAGLAVGACSRVAVHGQRPTRLCCDASLAAAVGRAAAFGFDVD